MPCRASDYTVQVPCQGSNYSVQVLCRDRAGTCRAVPVPRRARPCRSRDYAVYVPYWNVPRPCRAPWHAGPVFMPCRCRARAVINPRRGRAVASRVVPAPGRAQPCRGRDYVVRVPCRNVPRPCRGPRRAGSVIMPCRGRAVRARPCWEFPTNIQTRLRGFHIEVRKDPTSCRPIGVLVTVVKVFLKILLIRILKGGKKHDLLRSACSDADSTRHCWWTALLKYSTGSLTREN
jgi:hypothetical protein